MPESLAWVTEANPSDFSSFQDPPPVATAGAAAAGVALIHRNKRLQKKKKCWAGLKWASLVSNSYTAYFTWISRSCRPVSIVTAHCNSTKTSHYCHTLTTPSRVSVKRQLGWIFVFWWIFYMSYSTALNIRNMRTGTCTWLSTCGSRMSAVCCSCAKHEITHRWSRILGEQLSLPSP